MKDMLFKFIHMGCCLAAFLLGCAGAFATEPTLTLTNGTGAIKITSTGKDMTFKFDTSNVYQRTSITVNDQAYTADDNGYITIPALTADATMTVTYQDNTSTGVLSSVSNTTKVIVSAGVVRVVGANDDAEVKIYNVNGSCVCVTTEHSIVLPTRGVYILTVDGNTYKILY